MCKLCFGIQRHSFVRLLFIQCLACVSNNCWKVINDLKIVWLDFHLAIQLLIQEIELFWFGSPDAPEIIALTASFFCKCWSYCDAIYWQGEINTLVTFGLQECYLYLFSFGESQFSVLLRTYRNIFTPLTCVHNLKEFWFASFEAKRKW